MSGLDIPLPDSPNSPKGEERKNRKKGEGEEKGQKKMEEEFQLLQNPDWFKYQLWGR